MSAERPPSLRRVCAGPLLVLLSAASPAAAANLVAVGNFDTAADVAAWTPDGTDSTIAFNAALDVDDCGPSGSATVTNTSTSGFDTVYSRTCVQGVAPGTSYRFGLSAYFVPQAQTAEIWMEVIWYSDTACLDYLDAFTSPSALSTTPFTWIPVETTFTAPANAASAWVGIALYKRFSTSSIFGDVDGVFLRPAGDVFAEGLELGDPCRWSAVVP
jgi:hypothetical protein